MVHNLGIDFVYMQFVTYVYPPAKYIRDFEIVSPPTENQICLY